MNHRCLRLALWALLAGAGATQAQEAPLVFIAPANHALPFVDLQRGQLAGGILKDLGEAIAERTGRKASFLVVPSKRVSAPLDNGEADVLCYTAPAWIERRGEVVERLNPRDVPFAAPFTPSSGRVVVPKSDLLKGRSSHIDPRILNVHLSTLLTCNVPVVQRAVMQVLKKLDWAALARVVNP